MPRALKYPVAIMVMLLVCTGVAIAAIPNSDGTVDTCYNKQTGAVRVIDKPSQSCRTGEAALSLIHRIPEPKTYEVRNGVGLAAGQSRGVEVFCDRGDLVTGGGTSVSGFFPSRAVMEGSIVSYEFENGEISQQGWEGRWFNGNSDPDNTQSIAVVALCLDLGTTHVD
jgi:hypothetical protein